MIYEYLDKILGICCEEFDVSPTSVKSSSRQQEHVYCRKAFCVIVKDLFDVKYDIMAKVIERKQQDVSRYLVVQPENKYYKKCLNRIRNRVNAMQTFENS